MIVANCLALKFIAVMLFDQIQCSLSSFFCFLKVKQLLEKNERGHVVATCRNPNEATGLLNLKHKFDDRLSIQQLDVTVESTIEVTSLIIVVVVVVFFELLLKNPRRDLISFSGII